MNPEEFVELASFLPRAPFGTIEARVRTTAGRTYYGVFNLICQLLAAYGIKPGRDHGQIPTLLSTLASETKEDQFLDLGLMLGSLYEARRQADYVLSPRPTWVSKLQSSDYGDGLVSMSVKACILANGLLKKMPPRAPV